MERIPRICEAVIVAKGGQFDELRGFFFFGLISINVAQED